MDTGHWRHMQKIWMSMGKKHEKAGFGKLYGVQPSTHNAGDADQNTKWLSGAAFVHVTTCFSSINASSSLIDCFEKSVGTGEL